MQNNIYLTLIFMLMITTGLIIYFIYLKPNDTFTNIEQFTTTVPAPSINPSATLSPSATLASLATLSPSATVSPSATLSSLATLAPSATLTPVPSYTCTPVIPDINFKSLISRYFGIGFNIEYVNTVNNIKLYLIKHIPTTSNGTLGGCYAVSNANLLTIRLKNSSDDSQLWSIAENTDTVSKYYVVQSKINNEFALQYENGNLALRPFNSSSIFESQKWLLKTTEITRGIPVLNYSPGSLYTTEFDPYSTPSTVSNNITDQNSQQINDVITSVKTGIQQYLGQLNNNNAQATQITSSSLGNKDTPLNINMNLTSKTNQLSAFADITNNTLSNNTLSNDMLNIMDKYGASASKQSSVYTPLYRKTDLENEINTYQGCKLLNINDYTSNRVGSCNCKL